MTLTIKDFETDEQVAEIHEDGTIDAEDPMDEENIERYLGPNREAPYRHSSYEEGPDGNDVIAEKETLIEPGEQGYLTIVSEVLPSPYAVDWEKTDDSQLQDPVLEENDE